MEWNGMEWQSNSDLSIFHLKLKNRGGKKKVGRLVAVNPSRVGILMLACSSSHALFSMLAGLRLGSEGEGKKKKGYVEKEKEKERERGKKKRASRSRGRHCGQALYTFNDFYVCVFFLLFRALSFRLTRKINEKDTSRTTALRTRLFFFLAPCLLFLLKHLHTREGGR